MNIILYRYQDDFKKLNKTLPSTTGNILTLSGYLKDGSSVLNPVIEVTSTSTLVGFNYAYIQAFTRYYFVSIDSVSNNLWTLRLKVDVLYTYHTHIENTGAYIERTEASTIYSTLIDDDMLTFRNANDITITNLSNLTQGDLKNTDLKHTLNTGDYNIVLSVINDNDIQTFDEDETIFDVIASPPITNMSSVTYPEENGMTYYNYTYVASLVDINVSLKKIYEEAKADFIKSVVVFPFPIDTIKEKNEQGQITSNVKKVTLRLGNQNFGSNNVGTLKYGSIGFLTFLDYTFPNRTNFYDYEPYTTLEIFIPYVGWKTINISDVVSSRVLLTFRLNFETGKSNIYLINYTKNYVIASYDAQIGVVVPLSRSNMEQVNAQAISNGISMVLGVLGGAVSTTLGVASGNPIAISGGILSATNSLAKGIQNHIGNFERGQVQVKDGNNGLDNRNVLLKETRKLRASMPPSNVFGYPSKRSATIGLCSGYTSGVITKFVVDGGITIYDEEIDEIKRIFKEGIII